MKSAINRLARRDRRGVAALEFALVAPVLLFLFLGTIELGRYFLTQQNIRTLTAETARAALISPSVIGCPVPVTNFSRINAKTPFLNPGGLTVCITRGTDAEGRATINVTTTYAFATLVPFLNFLNGNVSDSTRLVYAPS